MSYKNDYAARNAELALIRKSDLVGVRNATEQTIVKGKYKDRVVYTWEVVVHPAQKTLLGRYYEAKESAKYKMVAIVNVNGLSNDWSGGLTIGPISMPGFSPEVGQDPENAIQQCISRMMSEYKAATGTTMPHILYPRHGGKPMALCTAGPDVNPHICYFLEQTTKFVRAYEKAKWDSHTRKLFSQHYHIT